MKKRFMIFLACFCCLLLAFPTFAAKSSLDDAKKKKNALAEEKKRAEATVKELEALKGDTAAYVKKLDNSLEVLSEELAQLDREITAKEDAIAAAKEDLEAAGAVEVSQYESMKLRIKYMYEKGDSNYVDLLMESGSLSELLNKVEYISKIAEYDREKLNEYAVIKAQIAQKEQSLSEEREELLSLQQQTEAKHASVEELLTAKQNELKNVENKLSQAENAVSEYEKDLKAQEDAIKAIEAELKRKEEEEKKKAEAAGKNYTTKSIGDIRFTWPCPASSRITSAFGSRSSPTEGASSNHKGIDIGAPTGTDIVAAASGTVVVSTYSYSAGNYVMLNHGGGVYTVYMHASQRLVSVGDTVKSGQVIAKVGSTGYSTGPHLHFGVRLNGTYVDPRQYVNP